MKPSNRSVQPEIIAALEQNSLVELGLQTVRVAVCRGCERRDQGAAAFGELVGIHGRRGIVNTWPGRMRFRFWMPLAAPIAAAVVPFAYPIFPSVSPALTV